MSASNLPTTQRFKFEDYPGMPQVFAQFLNALNLFINPVYQILDGGVAYQNLIAPQLFVKTITTPAAGSVAFNFTNPLKIVPTAVLLGNVYQMGNPATHPSAQAGVYWHFSQGVVYIDNITNLLTSTAYVVTLVIL